MYIKVVRFFTTVIFSLIPFFLLAKQIETQISADTITVERGGVLFAEGNVLVQYGKSEIKARALKFNQKTKKIKFKKRYFKSYPTLESMGQLTFSVKKIKSLTKKTAYLIGEFYLKRAIGDSFGHFTLIWKNIEGKWLIVSDHTSSSK